MTNTVNAERLGYAVPAANYPDIDDVTVADNDGVRTIFDLAFRKCYPGGPFAGRPAPGAGIEGAVIYDMTRTDSGDGDLSVAMVPENGSSLPWVGGGFDLSDTTAGETAGGIGVMGPAAALADIWNPAPAGAVSVGETQHFLWVGYYKLPLTADWAATGAIRSIFSACTDIGGYTAETDILNISMRAASPYQIDARRQIAEATAEATTIIQPNAADYGKLVQLAYWRNAAGSVFQIKSAAATTKSAATVHADNTQNFSALRPLWGHPATFYAGPEGYSGLRVYRGWLENLARSGRDPETVLDADWARVAARGVFS